MDQTVTKTGAASGEQLAQAHEFARRAHSGQRRKQNGRPFIEHPVAVAELVAGQGMDDSVLVAAFLHDTVEKTDIELPDIERAFGSAVAELVEALTEDETIDGYGARKRGLRDKALEAGRDAALVYAADRLANIRDWSTLEQGTQEDCAKRLGTTFDERLDLWQEDLAALNSLDRQLPFLEQFEFELLELRAGPEA